MDETERKVIVDEIVKRVVGGLVFLGMGIATLAMGVSLLVSGLAGSSMPILPLAAAAAIVGGVCSLWLASRLIDGKSSLAKGRKTKQAP